jgi:hypothetical protein
MKARRYGRLDQQKRLVRAAYDAFGRTATACRALDWKTRIFFERAVPVSPNARCERRAASLR